MWKFVFYMMPQKYMGKYVINTPVELSLRLKRMKESDTGVEGIQFLMF